MKRIGILTIIFCFFVSIVSAKEYRIEDKHISLDIPDNFVVATLDNIPDSLLILFQTTREKFRKEVLANQKSVLYCLNQEDLTEMWLVVNETEESKSVGDALNYKVSPEKFRPYMTEFYRKQQLGARLTGIGDYRTSNAYYIVCEAFKYQNGKNLNYQMYLTTKNGSSIGFNGICYSNRKEAFHNVMKSIVDSAKYNIGLDSSIPNTVSQSTSSNTSSISGNSNIDKALSRGLVKGLCAGIFLVIIYFAQYLWRKFKVTRNEKTSCKQSAEVKDNNSDTLGEKSLDNDFKSEEIVETVYSTNKGTMYCSKCGHKLSDGDVFCSKCGSKIAEK